MKRIAFLLIVLLCLTSCMQPKILDGYEYAKNVKWHPSGSSISYVAAENGYLQLFEKDIDTAESKKVIETLSETYGWSPDGNSIVFFSKQLPGDNPESRSYQELKIFNRKKNEVRTILTIEGPESNQFHNPSFSNLEWSDDGMHILFRVTMASQIPENWEESSKERAEQYLVYLQAKLNGSGYYVISPDGENLRKIYTAEATGIIWRQEAGWAHESHHALIRTDHQTAFTRIDIETNVQDKEEPTDIVCGEPWPSETIPGRMLSPDGKHYLYEKHKGSDMGFSGPYRSDFFVKKSSQYRCQPPDTDSDGTYDYLDTDDDNDGFSDYEEMGMTSIIDSDEHP